MCGAIPSCCAQEQLHLNPTMYMVIYLPITVSTELHIMYHSDTGSPHYVCVDALSESH